jgi:uncharacterized protein YukE
VDELQAALALERKAHRHAVQQYVDALDAKSTMTLQLQEMQQQLGDLQQAHSSLQQQHHNLKGHYDNLASQCTVVRACWVGTGSCKCRIWVSGGYFTAQKQSACFTTSNGSMSAGKALGLKAWKP